MEWLRSIAADARLVTLLALVVLDLALGVLASLRTGTFAWAEVGRFYRTQVLPVFGGWVVVRLVVPYVATDLLGPEGSWLGEGLVLLFWAAGVIQLLASIAKSVGNLGITIGDKS